MPQFDGRGRGDIPGQHNAPVGHRPHMHRLIEDLQRGDRHRRRVRIVADALRTKGVEALDAAEEQFARSTAVVSARVELVALQTVADIEIPA